jgi:hypothetical protein
LNTLKVIHLFIIKSILVFVLDFVYCQNFFVLFLMSLAISLSLFFTAFRVKLFTWLSYNMGTLVIDEEKVKKRLHELTISKSPGPDGLHPRILHDLYEELGKPLCLCHYWLEFQLHSTNLVHYQIRYTNSSFCLGFRILPKLFRIILNVFGYFYFLILHCFSS